ncbi:hypothetical protein MKEN_00315800 [Mycena kentingensis (nom. inval.)]|nr:hypothetical protein MKEN_00315800 [Mycena kentingensis (nom. inval.)]
MSLESSMLQLIRDRKQAIETELGQLSLRTRSLQAESQRIAETLNRVVYPVASLPADVLGEIFARYVHSAVVMIGMVSSPLIPDSATFARPLVLAAVCRTWRSVALSMPILWTKFEIYTEKNLEGVGNLLKVWLPRAKTRLLDIEICSPRATKDILPMLIPYSTYWDALSCGVKPEVKFSGNAIRGRVPKLRRLELSLQYAMDYDRPRPSKLDAFAVAPLLRDVHIVGFSFNKIDLPWAQLTKLQLGEVGANDAINMLRIATNLQELTLSFDEDRYHEPTGDLPLRLPLLERLTLSTSPDFLQYLVLPTLTMLSLGDEIRSTVLTAFIARSKCTITHVGFATVSCDPALQVLQHLSAAIEVKMVNLVWETFQLKAFLNVVAGVSSVNAPWGYNKSASGDVPPFLPKLESLILNPMLRGPEIPYAIVAELLVRRRDAGRALKELELVVGDPPGFPGQVSTVSRSSEEEKEEQVAEEALKVLQDEFGLGNNVRIRGSCMINQTTDYRQLRR